MTYLCRCYDDQDDAAITVKIVDGKKIHPSCGKEFVPKNERIKQLEAELSTANELLKETQDNRNKAWTDLAAVKFGREQAIKNYQEAGQERNAAHKEIKQLKKMLSDQSGATCQRLLFEAYEKLDAANLSLGVAQEALRKYGKHFLQCELNQEKFKACTCICGLAEALALADKAVKP